MTAIDIEELVQWAMSQTGYLPWRGVSERELAFDHGYTVIPKGCGLDYRGGHTLLRRAISDDAAIVVEAIKSLEPRVAAMVIACGRECIRPNWLPGIEPRQVAKRVYGARKRKRRGRPAVVMTWVPCDPSVIRAARSAYEQWHAALLILVSQLDGALAGLAIKGLEAPARPWEVAERKIA